MTIVKPKALKKGDTIGIVAPASPHSSNDKLNRGIRYLEQLGYKLVIGKHINDKLGYLAGTDKGRASDINNFFSDKKIKAIFCTRGGYGSHRILEQIDYDIIKRNPKIFVGYSDITALQLAILKKTGLITFAGPMLVTDLSKKLSADSEEHFWKCLTSPNPMGVINLFENQTLKVLTHGKVAGKIIGGNLSVIAALAGTSYLPSFINSILIFEDIDERPYRIDRMLHQLNLADLLDNLSGVILGDFSTCLPEKDKPSLKLEEIFKSVLKNIPIIMDIKFGHIPNSITIPYGINVKLDTKKNEISFLESAVTDF
ncbi:MAG: LD-carboxypeptidase [Bacteroidota bacterium]|nr:LD-carboxypeptidase [Bacteroidota bacterium]